MKKFTIKQQAENAIRWIKALLSGRYKQGTKELGDKNGYCCWGLGCQLMKIPFDKDDVWSDTLYTYIGFKNKDGAVTPELKNTPEYTRTTLDRLNDNEDFTFKEIASFLITNATKNFVPGVAKEIRRWYNAEPKVKTQVDKLYKKLQEKHSELA